MFSLRNPFFDTNSKFEIMKVFYILLYSRKEPNCKFLKIVERS